MQFHTRSILFRCLGNQLSAAGRAMEEVVAAVRGRDDRQNHVQPEEFRSFIMFYMHATAA